MTERDGKPWRRPPRCLRGGRAFTLLEMIVTVAIVAVTAVVVAPAFRDDSRIRLVAAANVLSSDIELAQVMTMSYPQQPVVVRFDTANQRYWLAYNYDPDTPIMRPQSDEPYEVTLGEGRAVTAENVAIVLDSMTSDTLEFNEQGGLVDFASTPRIQLSRDDRSITLSIAPTTGTIRESDGTIEDVKNGG